MMATTFAGTATFGLVAGYAKSDAAISLPGIINYTNAPTSYTNGTGSNQVNAFYASLARSLAGTGESFDLNAITDIYGATLNFTALKMIFVRNLSTTTGQYLTLSGNFWDGDTSNLGPLGGASPVAYIGPGGSFLWDSPINGATVTNTTKDIITVTNAATFSYDIILLGLI